MKKLLICLLVSLLCVTTASVRGEIIAFDDFDGGITGFTSTWSGTQFGLVTLDPALGNSFQALGTSTSELTSANGIADLDVTGDATYYLSCLYYATGEDQYAVLKFRNGGTPAGIPSILWRNSGWADAYIGAGSTANEIDFAVDTLYLAVLKADCNPTGTDDAVWLNMYDLSAGETVPLVEPAVWHTDGFAGNTTANFVQTFADNVQLVGRGSIGSTFDNVIVATTWLDVASLYADMLEITVPENGSNTFDIELLVDPNNYPLAVDIICSEPNAINPAITSDYDLTVSPLSVEFTSAEGVGHTETITLTGVNNTVPQFDRQYYLILSYDDPNAVITPEIVRVTVEDDDTPTVILTGADALQLDENDVATTETFTISVDQQPVEDVVVTLSANADFLTLDVASATFTSASYAPVVVTVTVVDNALNDTAPVPYEQYVTTIVTGVTGADDVADPSVTILENDCGAFGYNDYDVDTDCDVDLSDFAAFAAEWLKCQFPNQGDVCP